MAEIKAEEALPNVLELLKQDEEFNWFWMGDFSTEGFWEILYYIGGNALDELKKLVLEQRNWGNRIVPITVMEQIALHP